MFERIRSFLYRHRRKFLISGILFGSAIFLTRFTQRKIREWQEKEIRELLENSKRQQHFEATERTCDQTILNFASTLRKSITNAINTEIIVEQLQQGGSVNKVEAWNKLKVLAFSRTTVIVYSYAMLVATLRVQVNLIGGYFYKDSLNPNVKMLSEEISHEYLSLISYFMKEGIEKLCDFVNEKVKQVTSNVSLKDELNLRDVEQVYWSIVSAIMMDAERDPTRNLAKYVMKNEVAENRHTIVSKMTKETIDLLGSHEVRNLIQNTIASGFHVIIDHISDYFENNAKQETKSANPVAGPSTAKDMWESGKSKDGSAGFLNFVTARKPMAKIIPILNGQVPNNPKSGDMPSDWLQRLIFNDKYKTLGANVYEAFSC